MTVFRCFFLATSLALLLAAGPAPASAQTASDSTYTVKEGDTLYSIARRVGVSVKTLQAWNDLEGTQIIPGQSLRVRPPRDESPDAPSPDDSSDDSSDASDSADADAAEAPPADDESPQDDPTEDAPAENDPAEDESAEDTPAEKSPSPDTARVAATSLAPYGRHRTDAGDTFLSLALRYGTTGDSLFALNDSLTRPLGPDTEVRLPRRFGPPTHVVQPDETIYSIAGTYGVSARALQAANDLSGDSLAPGRRLQVPGREGPAPAPPGALAAPDTTGSVAVYPSTFEGRLTASGATYDPATFVGSHPSLPYGSVVLLTRPDAGRSTFVRIVDRGPIEEAFLMDVSRAAADQLGLSGGDADGNTAVELRVVWVE